MDPNDNQTSENQDEQPDGATPQEGRDSGPPAPHELLAASVHEALRSVFDPEIPVNVVEIGLIYSVKSDPVGNIDILMTLTAPNCPAAQTLPLEVEEAAKLVPGVQSAKVEIVWDPPWTPARMSEAAKLQLNLPYL